MKKTFPIVGIGASAGGLEASIQLLSKMPPDTGMAFVLVQHLDPAHPSMSAEIISKSTLLKVQEAEDAMRVKPDNVYVIPPNYNLSIAQGILNLSPVSKTSRQNVAIDFFLQSLAHDKKNTAIGVILSGTGSDGTLGLEAIKDEGGITCAQDPASAKYDGMPKSAIAAGNVDLILRPESLAKELARLAAHPRLEEEIAEHPSSDENLRKVFNLLRNHTSVDFTNYKRATISRRIQRRMMLQKTKDLESYAKYLQTNPEEVKALYNDILINVTEFFRDPTSFEALTQFVFPKLIKDGAAQAPLRIWVPGCSMGEEAYSIAIALTEFLEKAGAKNPIQIFATDISERSIQKARLGCYPESIAKSVSKERLKIFFEKTSDGYKVHKSIRDLCIFSRHDMTRDPPFAQLDLISCRNVLIYFAPVLQKQALPIFHYALKPNGFLWLGRSETPGAFSKLFTQVNKTHKFYSKSNVPSPTPFRFPVSTYSPQALPTAKVAALSKKAGADLQSYADKILLSKFVPPSVIVNADMEILQFRGRIVPFLEPALSNHLLKVARPELLASLRTLIQSAKKENKLVKRENLHFEAEGRQVTARIEALPINPLAPPEERAFLILFEKTASSETRPGGRGVKAKRGRKGKKHGPSASHASKDQQISELLLELSGTQESQHSLVEQYEATQEELTSTNEELQSTNEELQSTNEELETAKEELQSTNEELVTVNDELQIRNVELTTLGNDLTNLLSSTEIPILMVGNDKRIRRFTPKAEATFNLIPADVGRPLRDIQSNFNLDLDSAVTEVTRSLKSKEIEVQDREGAWWRLQIRPYKTIDNKIDGAIIALIDIEQLKQKEKQTKDAFEYVKAVAETVPLPLIVLNRDLQIKSVNHAFYKHFRDLKEPSGKDLFPALGIQEDSSRRLRQLFSRLLNTNTPFTDFELESEFPTLGHRIFFLSGRKIQGIGDEPESVLLSFADVTERKRIEEDRRFLLMREQGARSEAEKANRTKDVFLATLSHELRTPLSSILTWAQLIRMGKVDLEKAKQGAAIIEQSAKTQGQLIDDLLDISRIISGKLALEIKTVNLASVIHAAVESVRPMSEKKSISIEIVLSPGNAMILGDPTRLQQIVWNLLTNAVKFSPKDSRIEVRLEQTGAQVKRLAQIKIIDRGPGIPPDFLPHIFNRFSQADSTSTRVHGGLGLGLSIVRNLAELQGGTVQAENAKEGKGAIFTVTFPLVSSEAKQGPSKGGTPSKEGGGTDQPRLDGLRVLFVDDDESTREAICACLQSFGAEVASVDSASEALKSLPAFKPHIMVSDIAMPGEDGYALMRKIRNLTPENGGKVPAVALTAYASGEHAKRAREAGFQAHIAKPVEAEELAWLISKLAVRGIPSETARG